jgi:dTMP kinase
MQGVFISFEGTEGSGKSTQIEKLAQRLRAEGHLVRLIREPGGTALGEEIRNLLKHHAAGQRMVPETELLLMNASRAQLVQEIILPSLRSGEIVLCDRFFDSTVAYQGFGRGLDLEMIRHVIFAATAGIRPDMTFYLHVPVAISEERRKARNTGSEPEDRFEMSARAFFERVEEGFLTVAEADADRVKTIDATGTRDEVSKAISEYVQNFMEKRDETTRFVKRVVDKKA